MQQFVFFDAVGTIIDPDPHAAKVYYRVGKKYGSALDEPQVSQRFSAALKKHFHAGASRYEQPASDFEDKLKWRRIVAEVFQTDLRSELFEELWTHFSDPTHWKVHPSIYDMIDRLQSKQISVAIASNFDSRLCEICSSLFPMIPAKLVFYSTQLGYAKPDVRFYKQIEKRIQAMHSSLEAIMIGDNWSLDVEAAKRAGWRSIWKRGNRFPSMPQIESHFFRST